MSNTLFDIEFDDDEVVPPRTALVLDAVLAPEPSALVVPLAQSMPDGFDIQTLLQFLPDVRLKQRLDKIAEDMLALDVKTDDGRRFADKLLADAKDVVKEIETAFKYPTDLANTLHKRLTGLRADFCKNGAAAIETTNRALLAEEQRRKREAEEQRRRDQEEADKAAREQAKERAKEAKAEGAPKAVVQELQQQAKTAVAPPVPLRGGGGLRSNTVAERWCFVLDGTEDGTEPNPAVEEMTEMQRASLLVLLRAIAEGKAKVVYIKELNWALLNAEAKSERTTMAVPGGSAKDVGSLRKARR